MTDHELLNMLDCGDPDVILEALFALGGRRSDAPSEELLEEASRHFFHPDSDVRRQAVISVAIHWGYVPALDGLITLLGTEPDDSVLDALISAVARIGRAEASSRSRALSALGLVAADNKHCTRLRHLAYVEARWMCGELSPGEHAKEGLDPEQVPLNLAWFDQALCH